MHEHMSFGASPGDAGEGDRQAGRQSRRPLWLLALVFAIVVVLLQWGWGAARGTAIERAVIDDATVMTVASMINTWTPEAQALAVGASIKAPGGGINILNGCEGTEVLFLLIAGLVAYPMSWRWRAIGTVAGMAYVFVLNQLRLLALFYSYRTDRTLFDLLHGLIAPMLLIAMSLAFMVLVIRLDARGRTDLPLASLEART